MSRLGKLIKSVRKLGEELSFNFVQLSFHSSRASPVNRNEKRSAAKASQTERHHRLRACAKRHPSTRPPSLSITRVPSSSSFLLLYLTFPPNLDKNPIDRQHFQPERSATEAFQVGIRIF